MRGFYIRAPFPVIARIDATVAYLADALLALGDTSTLDQRRVKALLVMANPTEAVQILEAFAASRAGTDRPEAVDTTKLLPTVWLYVHLADQELTARRPGRGTRSGLALVGQAAPGSRLPVQDHPGPSTWPDRRPWTPGRSRTDIDRPCI